jgi:hypothetical protein
MLESAQARAQARVFVQGLDQPLPLQPSKHGSMQPTSALFTALTKQSTETLPLPLQKNAAPHCSTVALPSAMLPA